MAAAYAAVSSIAWGTRTNTVVPAAGLGTIANGDVLLGLILTYSGTGDAVDPTPPGGFNAAPGSWPIDLTMGAANMEARLYLKIASGESGDYTFTHASADSQASIVRATGVDNADPFQPDPTLNQGIGVTTTATGLTVAADGTLIVFYSVDWDNNATSRVPPTGSTPTFTERYDTNNMYIATGDFSGAGATGDKSMSNRSNSDNPWAGILVALQPTTGAPPQQLRPDADTVVTGWTPSAGGNVYSVISDEADGTYASATLA